MQEIKMITSVYVGVFLFWLTIKITKRILIRFKDYWVIIHWDGISFCEIKTDYFGLDDIQKISKWKSFRIFKHGKPSSKRPTSSKDKGQTN